MTLLARATFAPPQAMRRSRSTALLVRLLSCATLLVACVVAGLGAPELLSASVFVALVPILVVHAWCVLSPNAVPIGVVFLAGLWVDCLSNGPLGLWALAYVVSALISDSLLPIARRGPLGHALTMTLTLTSVTALLWLSASIYAVRWVPPNQLVAEAALAALVYLMLVGCVAGLAMGGRWAIGRRFNVRGVWP